MTTVDERVTAAGIDSRKIGALATQEQDVRSREAVFRVENLSVSYSGALALDGVTLDVAQERGHGVHRPVGLRQVARSSAASTA